MRLIPLLKTTCLIAVLLSVSGYRFRCYMACVDQTGIQNDYVEQREKCREYAQLKVRMAMREAGANADDKAYKSSLVALFSSCMGANGWTVPDGKPADAKKPDNQTPVLASAGTAGPSTAVAPAAAKVQEKAQLSRSAECAFARHSASVSSIAKKRAEACDLQCAEQLRIAPDAPRPASCAPEFPAKYSRGNEK